MDIIEKLKLKEINLNDYNLISKENLSNQFSHVQEERIYYLKKKFNFNTDISSNNCSYLIAHKLKAEDYMNKNNIINYNSHHLINLEDISNDLKIANNKNNENILKLISFGYGTGTKPYEEGESQSKDIFLVFEEVQFSLMNFIENLKPCLKYRLLCMKQICEFLFFSLKYNLSLDQLNCFNSFIVLNKNENNYNNIKSDNYNKNTVDNLDENIINNNLELLKIKFLNIGNIFYIIIISYLDSILNSKSLNNKALNINTYNNLNKQTGDVTMNENSEKIIFNILSKAVAIILNYSKNENDLKIFYNEMTTESSKLMRAMISGVVQKVVNFNTFNFSLEHFTDILNQILNCYNLPIVDYKNIFLSKQNNAFLRCNGSENHETILTEVNKQISTDPSIFSGNNISFDKVLDGYGSQFKAQEIQNDQFNSYSQSDHSSLKCNNLNETNKTYEDKAENGIKNSNINNSTCNNFINNYNPFINNFQMVNQTVNIINNGFKHNNFNGSPLVPGNNYNNNLNINNSFYNNNRYMIPNINMFQEYYLSMYRNMYNQFINNSLNQNIPESTKANQNLIESKGDVNKLNGGETKYNKLSSEKRITSHISNLETVNKNFEVFNEKISSASINKVSENREKVVKSIFETLIKENNPCLTPNHVQSKTNNKQSTLNKKRNRDMLFENQINKQKDKIILQETEIKEDTEESINKVTKNNSNSKDKNKKMKIKIHKIKKQEKIELDINAEIKSIGNFSHLSSEELGGEHYLESENNLPIKKELEKYSAIFDLELKETINNDIQHTFMFENFPSMYKLENFYVHIKKQKKKISFLNRNKFQAKVKKIFPFTNFLEEANSNLNKDKNNNTLNNNQTKKVWDSKVLDSKEGIFYYYF